MHDEILQVTAAVVLVVVAVAVAASTRSSTFSSSTDSATTGIVLTATDNKNRVTTITVI